MAARAWTEIWPGLERTAPTAKPMADDDADNPYAWRRPTSYPASGGCPGCRAHPMAQCAACGRPAVVALDASTPEALDAGTHDGTAHACPLCARCHAEVLAVRAETARWGPVAPLVYLVFTPPLPDREDAAG